MITCAQCATPIPDGSRFCLSCGSRVSDGAAQAAAAEGLDSSALQHLEALLRQEVGDEFQVHRLLGRGGMAAVYLATEVHLSRKVAIKVLPPELTFGHGIDRFMREARTAAALDHPHIIPIYRVASPGGKIFWYAMKFLEGRSLEDVLRDQRVMPLGETIDILTQVADALDYAHAHGVIHRDIKPANVMLDARNRVVVTDFGIAKALTEHTLTASGAVVGTPYYMSPEQGLGHGVSGRSDQYAVGVLAFRMLSGQVPFEGDSAIDILHKQAMVPAPPLGSVAPALPAHASCAVHRALEKKPEARFASVTAFVQALAGTGPLEAGAAAATVALPARPATRPTAPGARAAARGSRRWPIVLALVLALLAGAALGWWRLERQTGAPPAGATTQASAPAPPTPAVPQAVAQTGQVAPLSQPGATGQPARGAEPHGRRDIGLLIVRDLPRPHRLFVDGQPRLSARVALPPGDHDIRVVSPREPPFEMHVAVVAGEFTVVSYADRTVHTGAPRTPRP